LTLPLHLHSLVPAGTRAVIRMPSSPIQACPNPGKPRRIAPDLFPTDEQSARIPVPIPIPFPFPLRGCDQKWVRIPLGFTLRNGGLGAPSTAPPLNEDPCPIHRTRRPGLPWNEEKASCVGRHRAVERGRLKFHSSSSFDGPAGAGPYHFGRDALPPAPSGLRRTSRGVPTNRKDGSHASGHRGIEQAT